MTDFGRILYYAQLYKSSCIVIDCSSSMEDSKLTQAKKGAIEFAHNAFVKGYFVGLILSSEAGNNMSHQGISMSEILIMGGIGIGFLVLCRILIRRGSI